jgi:hypothetical protein
LGGVCNDGAVIQFRMSNYKYILLCVIAAVLTILIHELTHWLTGELLGYKMIMTLNSGWPAKGFYDAYWHYNLISAVGPGVTLIQTIVLSLLIKKYPNRYLYPFLFAPFFLELLSGLMNFRHANDLGRISVTLHLGLFTLSILVVGIHFALVYFTSRREKYDLKFNAVTLGWIALFSFVWIGINQIEKVYLIK